MLPNLQSKMPWDILRDFEPVSLVATVEWGLVVGTDAPQRSAADTIVQMLHAEITKALEDPEVCEKLIGLGLTPRGTSPDELAKAMRVQLTRRGTLIKQAGITAN